MIWASYAFLSVTKERPSIALPVLLSIYTQRFLNESTPLLSLDDDMILFFQNSSISGIFCCYALSEAL